MLKRFPLRRHNIYLRRFHSNYYYNDFYDVDTNAKSKIDLIILNTPIHPLLNTMWPRASRRVCADGGSNRLFKFNKDWIPTYISGDLDSIQDEVLQYYKNRGTIIKKSPDQDSNDLQKCIQLLKEEGLNDNMVVVEGYGGRFDHSMCNINALFENMNIRITLVTPSSVIFLLPPGKHIIQRNKKFEKVKCGIIPIGEPCRQITTNGLKWNLKGQELKFGGLVSTSNEFLNDTAIVENSNPVLWSTNLIGHPP